MPRARRSKAEKDDLRSVLDDQFLAKTLLALPITGILVFTVIPILFMLLVAFFTNYDGAHDGYSNLFYMGEAGAISTS